MIRRAVFRLIALLPFGASLGAVLWSLSLSPLTAPLVDRTAEETLRAIDRALARQVTPDWLASELDTALAAGDWDRVQTLALIGADRGLAPSSDHLAQINALEAANSGFVATAADCLVCMADVGQCPSLSALAACGVPFELTPLGDVNALRRAGMAAMAGEEIDTLDVTLALAGLGATAAVTVTGGTSYTAKAGTTAVRLGRRLGTITAPFLRVLGDLANVELKADKILPWLVGRVPLDDVLDTARLAGLQDLGADLGRVAGNTSSVDAVRLLRYVDDAEDAANLARASDVLGPRTTRVFEVLGKDRVFRALVRLSNLALSAAAALALLALQIAAALGHLIGTRLILRPLGRWAGRQAKS